MNIEKIRKQVRKNTTTADLDARQLISFIDTITGVLRGIGIGDVERIVLNEERHIYREALAKLDASTR